MKRGLLFSAAMLMMAASTMAQTDVTPSRYKFAEQSVGQYTFDYVNPGANPPASLAAVTENWNNGFFMLAGAPPHYTGPNAEATQKLQAGFNIVDMGGTVGKVLCFRGTNSTYEVGTPATAVPGWFNLNFYSDPDNTPISSDKGQTNKIRVRLVFSIYQNTISETASLLKFYCSTATNNIQGDQHTNFCSGDFMALDEDGDPDVNEDELYYYDPTRWMVYEFDTWVPEVAGAPTRLKIEMPAQADYTVLFKEIKFMTDVTGDPIQRKYESYTPSPTGIETLQKNNEALYVMDGDNIIFVDKAEVYSVSGAKVAKVIANEPITLNRGFYVAKVGQKTTKIVVK